MRTLRRMWNDHKFIWAVNAILIGWSIPVMLIYIFKLATLE
jgi:hypothetical protein